MDLPSSPLTATEKTMTDQTKKLLIKTRWLAVLFAFGVTLLSAQSLWQGYRFFQYAALILAIGGLTLISLIVSRIIRIEKS
jgi:hypothetical protein